MFVIQDVNPLLTTNQLIHIYTCYKRHDDFIFCFTFSFSDVRESFIRNVRLDDPRVRRSFNVRCCEWNSSDILQIVLRWRLRGTNARDIDDDSNFAAHPYAGCSLHGTPPYGEKLS